MEDYTATQGGMWSEKAGRREFSSIGLRVLLGGIAIYGVQMIAQYLLLKLPVFADRLSDMNFVLVFGMVVPMYAIGFPIAFLIMKNGGDRRTIGKKQMRPLHFFVAFLISYVFLWTGNLVGLAVTVGIGALKGAPVSNDLYAIVGGTDMWLILIFMVLLGPVFEELLMRRMLCDRVIKYGQGTAILLSGLLFGLFHGNLNQFFYAFAIGCFLAFIYVKTGNVKYTIGIHMLINFLGSVPGSLLLKYVDLEHLSLETLKGPTIILLALYILAVYAILIAGFVLLLINRSKLKADAGEIVLEKKERNRIVFGNAGMILCIVCFALMMLVQAFLG